MNRLSFMKEADLFSRPFQFSVGESNTKKRRTLFGGLLSFVVIIVSLVYLFYLLFVYFSHGFLPKMVKQYFNGTVGSISVTQNFIAFQIIAGGMPLADYQALHGVEFFKLNFYYQIFDGLTYSTIPLPQKACDASSLSAGLICLDFDAMPESQKVLAINAQTNLSKSYFIQVAKCALPQTCATPTDIQALVVSPQTYLVIHTSTSTYNTIKGQLDYSLNIEYFQFDSTLLQESVFSMIQSMTEVISGPVIQTKERLNHLIGLKRFDRPHTQTDAVSLLGVDGYLHFEFRLDQNYEENTIQYPMITEVLTQFTSVLNMLLVCGIIANTVAESDMIQDISSLLLKEQYKNTSLELIEQKNRKENKNNREEVEEGGVSCAEEIIRMQEEIENSNFKDHAGTFFKVPLLSRAKMILFGVKKKKNKVRSEDTRDLKEQQIFKKMIALTEKRVDIYELYKDLIQIKMVLKFLLSADQFAAISHCGGSIQLENIIIQPGVQNKAEDVASSAQQQEVAQRKQVLKDTLQQDQQLENEGNCEIIVDEEDVYKPGSESGGGTEAISEHRFIRSAPTNKTEGVSQSQLQKSLRTRLNHLDVLDSIEQNPEIKQNQLRAFIQRIQSAQFQISVIDQRICTALIGQQKRNKA